MVDVMHDTMKYKNHSLKWFSAIILFVVFRLIYLRLHRTESDDPETMTKTTISFYSSIYLINIVQRPFELCLYSERNECLRSSEPSLKARVSRLQAICQDLKIAFRKINCAELTNCKHTLHTHFDLQFFHLTEPNRYRCV